MLATLLHISVAAAAATLSGAVKLPDSSGPVLPGQQEQAPGSGEEHKEDGAGQAEDGLHFKQVYWVCDAAWPTDAQEQVRPNSSKELEVALPAFHATASTCSCPCVGARLPPV